MQFNRLKGESGADFCARKDAAGMSGAPPKPARKRKPRRDPVADRIDGYDHDDLGESQDY